MNIIDKLSVQLRLKRSISVLSMIVSFACFSAVISGILATGSLTFQFLLSSALVITGIIIAAFFGIFSKPKPKDIVRFLDRNYPVTEESSALLVHPPKTILEQWQREKIESKIQLSQDEINIPRRFLNKAVIISSGIFLMSILLFFTVPQVEHSEQITLNGEATIQTFAEDEPDIPSILNGEITVNPPEYTKLQPTTEPLRNFSAPEQSDIEWAIQTNDATDSVRVRFNNRSVLNLSRNNTRFEGSGTIENSQIFQIEITSRDTTIQSDFYTLTVIDDRAPQFLFQSPAEQRSFIDHQKRSQLLDVQIEDDYGITRANIHATLARGSGENVRFRERTISFDEISELGTSTVNGRLILHADSLEMQPGDELYFYVNAQDNKPEPQTGRSDTYFIIYSDSTRDDSTPFSGMVVDLTPEDLRSQRQVIIDTEELLDEKPDLNGQQFRDRADRIAQNQALLRLRYGEYLGLENESGMTEADIPQDTDVHTSEQNHDQGSDHDHGNLDEEGFERAQSDMAALTPEDFGHDHGSAEMNTLFGDSPMGYLREALANMWDAERYLRMSDLEQALPFEYQALEFLQLAQQAERRYVRRAGYEGDPISVDEVRLTEDVDNFAGPGSTFDRNIEPGPLSNLQYMIRDHGTMDSSAVEQANQWIQQADLTAGDRLYLMNRLRVIESEGMNDEVRRNLLETLEELTPQTDFDPSPAKRPILRQFNR